MKRIYLDHSATTALHPEVLEAMLPYLSQKFGNASSVHSFGSEARQGMVWARDAVAATLNCDDPREIIFTSGGTESDNLFLKGVGFALKQKGRGSHIVTTTIEHHAISHTCEWLEKNGFSVSYAPVGLSGIVDVEELRKLLRPETIMVSVMYANNEVGSILPIAEISQTVKNYNQEIVVHTDAVQTPGHLSLDVEELGVDALSLSAHKFYGPKGLGILYLRRGMPIEPRILGGGHEYDRRAGTENVAGMVGLATALQRVESTRLKENARLAELRDHLIAKVLTEISDCQLNGDKEMRLPTNANFSFHGVEGEAILMSLDLKGIAVSTGSACTSGQSSFVLKAMGIDGLAAQGCVRFTLGEENTKEDMDFTVDALKEIIARLRRISPLGKV
ncbi:MAG: cysteine desulfurase family protein [bacterium]|nr:cysteine desulfurase family protein [bacterium]